MLFVVGPGQLLYVSKLRTHKIISFDANESMVACFSMMFFSRSGKSYYAEYLLAIV